MIRSALTNALNSWVVGVTDREVVFDHLAAMGPRPSRPFCSMILNSAPIGRHTTTITAKAGSPAAPAPDLTETAGTINALRISMNLIDGHPFEDMQELRAAIALSTWRDVLRVGGLGYSTVSESRDLSEIVKSDYESRVQADWVFLASAQAQADVYSIEQIQIINSGRGTSITVGA